MMASLRKALAFAAPLILLSGCRRSSFPDVPAGYREFAYVTSGTGNTVSVLDLVYLRQDRTLRVGRQPSGVTVNPKRKEVYVVNTGDGTLSVIDATQNAVVSTIGVHATPYSIDVDVDGRFGYVANSGANTVSVIDLEKHREVATAGTGETPSMAKVAPDMRSLVVTNRTSGSVSIYALNNGSQPKLRATFDGCAKATDAVILPDSSKTFIACSGANKVMAISLAADPKSWNAIQDSSLLQDRLLTRLDVGKTPVHLALKPDGGEVFVSNFSSNTISEISTWTNEVGGTYRIGPKPARGIVSADNGMLFVSDFGASSISMYSIDDGKFAGSVRTGPAPDAIAFSADEHLLLAANSGSGDVSVIRTRSSDGTPGLFTMLPAGNSPNSIAVLSFHSK